MSDLKAYSVKFGSNAEHRRKHEHFLYMATKGVGASWVYFMRSGDHIKVGHSKNVVKRLAEIRLSNPLPVLLVGLIRGDQKFETTVHRAFRDHDAHVSGEWFEANEDIVWLVENLCDG